MKTKPDVLTWEMWDLDGTLSYPSEDDSKIGEPIPDRVWACKMSAKLGRIINIYTSRHWDMHDVIAEWCKEQGIPYQYIICGKPLALRYIDDRGFQPDDYVEGIKEEIYEG